MLIVDQIFRVKVFWYYLDKDLCMKFQLTKFGKTIIFLNVLCRLAGAWEISIFLECSNSLDVYLRIV